MASSLVLGLIWIGGVGACSVGQFMSHSEFRCQTCPTGQWQPSDPYWGQICRDTPAGYIPSANQSNIEPCPAQTFNPFKNSLKCINCITSTMTGSSVCHVMAPEVMQLIQTSGSNARALDDAPTSCGIGTSFSTQAKTACVECPDGTYQPSAEWTHDLCFPVDSGHYALPDKSAYGDCGPGVYSKDDLATECKNCTDGSVARSHVNVECFPAQAGYYALPSHTAEKACTVGHYADVEGSTECKECALGSHSEFLAASRCSHCNQGRFMNETGSKASECMSCHAGSFAGTSGLSVCLACEAGKLNQQRGSFSCDEAPEGYIPNKERTGLVECERGSFAKGEGNAICTKCRPGSSSNSTHAGTCQLCAPGRAMPQNGSTASFCVSCNNGKYAEGLGNSQCEFCAPGSYTDGNMKDELKASSFAQCEMCHPGEFQAEMGSSVCGECSAGSYSLKGSSVCTLCGKGEYSAQDGASYCLSCSSGEYNGGSGKTSCATCFAFDAALGFSYPDQCIPIWGWAAVVGIAVLCTVPAVFKYRQWRGLQPQATIVNIDRSVLKAWDCKGDEQELPQAVHTAVPYSPPDFGGISD